MRKKVLTLMMRAGLASDLTFVYLVFGAVQALAPTTVAEQGVFLRLENRRLQRRRSSGVEEGEHWRLQRQRYDDHENGEHRCLQRQRCQTARCWGRWLTQAGTYNGSGEGGGGGSGGV